MELELGAYIPYTRDETSSSCLNDPSAYTRRIEEYIKEDSPGKVELYLLEAFSIFPASVIMGLSEKYPEETEESDELKFLYRRAVEYLVKKQRIVNLSYLKFKGLPYGYQVSVINFEKGSMEFTMFDYNNDK